METIVLTPEEALDCFLRTDMDVLVMGSLVLEKPAPSDHRESSRPAADARLLL